MSNVKIKKHEKLCSSCGEVIGLFAKICPKCKVKQVDSTATKEKQTAFMKKLIITYIIDYFGIIFGAILFVGSLIMLFDNDIRYGIKNDITDVLPDPLFTIFFIIIAIYGLVDMIFTSIKVIVNSIVSSIDIVRSKLEDMENRSDE